MEIAHGLGEGRSAFSQMCAISCRNAPPTVVNRHGLVQVAHLAADIRNALFDPLFYRCRFLFRVSLQLQQIQRFFEGEAQRLAAADESEPLYRGRRVDAVARRQPLRRWDQPRRS